MQFDRNLIIEACGDRAFTRGLNYFKNGRVLGIEAEMSGETFTIRARTSGSGRNIYMQEIFVDLIDGFTEIEGECSCPVMYNCKHVAAVCLQYLSDTGSGVGSRDRRLKPTAASAHEIRYWLRHLTEAADQERIDPAGERLVYILSAPLDNRSILSGGSVFLEVRATHPRKNGRGLVKGRRMSLHSISMPYSNGRVQITPTDREIASLLADGDGYLYGTGMGATTFSGRRGALGLSMLLQTGRCYWHGVDNPALTRADPETLHLDWQEQENGDLELRHSLPAGHILLATSPVMFLDTEQHRAGELDTGAWNLEQLRVLGRAPRIPADQAEGVSHEILQNPSVQALPAPVDVEWRDNPGHSLSPCLFLNSRINPKGESEHCLMLEFDYDGDRVHPLPRSAQTVLRQGNDWVRVHRNLDAEAAARARLEEYGFVASAPSGEQPQSQSFEPGFEPHDLRYIECWGDFLESVVPALEQDGWRIGFSDDFRLRFESGDWEARVDDEGSGNDWFSLRFDLMVDDESIPLAPLLLPLLGQDPDSLPDTLSIALGDDRYVRLPSQRIKPFLNTLDELFTLNRSDDDGGLRISRYDVLSVADLADRGARLRGGNSLREMADRLRNFSGIQAVALPEGLQAELRPYQQAGLNWLQFLREFGFGGVLADDMGLGKTVQTLAHLLVEKQAGRLDKPALVVAPTSLMGNWQREAERFTPELRVIVLHGPERREWFEHIDDSHLVLTTYPLLSRDREVLLSHAYHSVILDEAQVVKNARTRMAEVVRQFDCDHRLCLTGTPLENHLGELWALFDFLMPGFLGDQTTFTRLFRTPIEKHGNRDRQRSLARRLEPFLLRRRKDLVAAELPAKTEILQTVQLGGTQAEIYESIRIAMDKRVREAIRRKGLASSHITILDALLKLRQVCCDPRLLKLDRAKTANQSAKLELLMNMLPEQIEEGRRIILFSQFTTMLSLIEAELKQHKLAYTKLTGQTRKRDAAIEKFRSGEVNLFLISLKAGGTGLNLTEADTVILYDPWWNPAVEAQAIDRAHRIGQDKPVFIYRLTVAGSVEERMLAMQERKRQLAQQIYAKNDDSGTALFDTESLQSLFAPIEQFDYMAPH